LAPVSSDKQIKAFVEQVENGNYAASDINQEFDSEFSFYLSKDPSKESYVTFGGYDLGQFAKDGAQERDVFWVDMVRGEKFWTVRMD